MNLQLPDEAFLARRLPALDVAAVAPAEWDALLAGFDDISFEQSAYYAAHRWGPKNLLCLAVRENGRVVGGAVCICVRVPGLGGIAHVKFGPLWRPTGTPARSEHYAAVITALRDHLATGNIAIRVSPRPHPHFTVIEAEVLMQLGFRRGGEPPDADRFLVDCSLPEDEQAASLGQTWRANLKKAQKAGLEIVDLDYAHYGEFRALYDRMSERKQVTLYAPVDIVPELRKVLPERMHPEAILVRHDGEAVGGVVYALIGDMAYYMFGATGDRALPLRAGYAMQWAVLERLRGKVKWYDLGGAPEEGLRQFKSGLVGKAGATVHMPGEFDYAATWRARLALALIYALRDGRNLLRTALKRIRRA